MKLILIIISVFLFLTSCTKDAEIVFWNESGTNIAVNFAGAVRYIGSDSFLTITLPEQGQYSLTTLLLDNSNSHTVIYNTSSDLEWSYTFENGYTYAQSYTGVKSLSLDTITVSGAFSSSKPGVIQ